MTATLRAAPPINTVVAANTIADLTRDRFRIVAARRTDGRYDHWDYTMPRADIVTFGRMADDGRVVSVQGDMDGVKVLFAKLARV